MDGFRVELGEGCMERWVDRTQKDIIFFYSECYTAFSDKRHPEEKKERKIGKPLQSILSDFLAYQQITMYFNLFIPKISICGYKEFILGTERKEKR